MGTFHSPTGLVAALSLAYRAIMALGITHQQLVDSNFGVNYNTLRRIREGKPGKPATDRFFLQLFFSILDREYERRVENGGDGAIGVLRVMREISRTLLEIPHESVVIENLL